MKHGKHYIDAAKQVVEKILYNTERPENPEGVPDFPCPLFAVYDGRQ